MTGSGWPDTAPRLRFSAYAATHNGTKRTHNEDRFVLRMDLGLWAVADGVGGQARGEAAAELVAARLQGIPPGLRLPERRAAALAALGQAHEELLSGAKRDGLRVAPSTTVVAMLVEEERYVCVWVGDSRAYRHRDGALRQLTRDHSLVQELVDMGALSREQAERHPNANMITRAIGQMDGPLQIDEADGELLPGDDLLLCSDGLSKALGDEAVARLLGEGEEPSKALVLAALAAQATDNVTAVTLHCR